MSIGGEANFELGSNLSRFHNIRLVAIDQMSLTATGAIELGSTLNYFRFAGYDQGMGRVPLISSCLAYSRPITTTSMLLLSMIRPFSSTSAQWPVAEYGVPGFVRDPDHMFI